MNTLSATRAGAEENPVLSALLALLFKHVECSPPLMVVGQWEKFVRTDRDLWKVDLLGAGAVRVRCDKLAAELRVRFNEHSGLRLANLVFFERGELQVLLLRRPRRSLTTKRHRELWDDESVPNERKDEVHPMELQRVNPSSPLLRAQKYLCTDLSEIRNGDRPLDMNVAATPRGVVVCAMRELRLADIDHAISSAQLIAAKFTAHRSAAEASVDATWHAVDEGSGSASGGPPGALEIASVLPVMQVHVNVADRPVVIVAEPEETPIANMAT